MKFVLLILIFFSGSLSLAEYFEATAPKCMAIGRSEGWVFPGSPPSGEVSILYDNCANKGVECRPDLTPGGWYSFTKDHKNLLSYANCKESKDLPICANIGTCSEGWVIPGDEKIHSAWCANEIVECGSIGTRSEGWYSFTKGPAVLLRQTRCAD